MDKISRKAAQAQRIFLQSSCSLFCNLDGWAMFHGMPPTDMGGNVAPDKKATRISRIRLMFPPEDVAQPLAALSFAEGKHVPVSKCADKQQMINRHAAFLLAHLFGFPDDAIRRKNDGVGVEKQTIGVAQKFLKRVGQSPSSIPPELCDWLFGGGGLQTHSRITLLQKSPELHLPTVHPKLISERLRFSALVE